MRQYIFCIVFKDRYILKRELLRQHIQNTPRYKIQKYLYGFYLKILSKQKKTS